MLTDHEKLSSALFDMYDIKAQSKSLGFDKKPKDTDGTIFTLEDCIDDVITFLESLEG